MLRLFNDNKPYVLLLLPFIAGVPFVIYYTYSKELFPSTVNFGLWGTLSISKEVRIWFLLFGYLAQLGGGIALNYLFNQSNLHERNNYMPSLLFCAFMSLSPLGMVFNGVQIAIISTIMTIHQLLHLAQNQSGLKMIFNASFVFGFSATLCTSFYAIIPLLFFIILTFRPFLLREFSTYILGMLLPSYFVFAYRNYYGFPYPWHEIQAPLIRDWASLGNVYLIVLTLLVSFAFIFALLKKWSGFINRTRKEIQFISWFLFFIAISGVLHLVLPSFYFHFLLFLVPICILFTFCFIGKGKAFIPSILFYGIWIFVMTKFIFKF